MSKITIELTEKQENFLKEFAAKQYDGAKDNVGTRTPIHVVERKEDIFIENENGNCFLLCQGKSEIYESFELLQQKIRENNNNPTFEAVKNSYFNDFFICNYLDYFDALGLDIKIGEVEHRYEPIAYFFILDEARRYMNEYQSHNCENCRIYTRGLGYSNYGDMPVFRNLLFTMGKQLNDNKKAEESLRIKLESGKYLVAEKTDPDYKEIAIGIEKDGVWNQDLAIIRNKVKLQDNAESSYPAIEPIAGKYEVLVYGNEQEEDYTDRFEIGEYNEEKDRLPELEPIGTWWNDNDIPLYTINGEVYALSGWNGTIYTDCWHCLGPNHIDADKARYTIRPVYRHEVEKINICDLEEGSDAWEDAIQVVAFDVY